MALVYGLWAFVALTVVVTHWYLPPGMEAHALDEQIVVGAPPRPYLNNSACP